MGDTGSDTLPVILTMLFLACVCLPCAKAIREWYRSANVQPPPYPEHVPVALPVSSGTTGMPVPSAPPHPDNLSPAVEMAAPVESLAHAQN